MITDLCPADVLLQRLGRLHRHRRGRPPGFVVPLAIMLAPSVARLAAMLAPDGSVRGGVMGFGRVYPDLLGIVATRRFLEAHPVLEIPALNRAYVEAATHQEARHPWAAHSGHAWGRAQERAGGEGEG